jgi:hypothetical protein
MADGYWSAKSLSRSSQNVLFLERLSALHGPDTSPSPYVKNILRILKRRHMQLVIVKEERHVMAGDRSGGVPFQSQGNASHALQIEPVILLFVVRRPC